MLTQLQIRDFAIVHQLELEFDAGMSAITGETGAGKSILVQALGLLLGDRADSAVVRHGAERAELVASFDIQHLPQARAWLAERELAQGHDGCHLRRLITHNGRSRAYINGTSQPLQALQELGEVLLDIHSQHEHQSLLKREVQRDLLDDYADHPALLAVVGEAYGRWNTLRREFAELQRADAERDTRLDLLRFQVQELAALALTEDEYAKLEAEHKKLANAGRLLAISEGALARLYEAEAGSLHDSLSKIVAELDSVRAVDATLAASAELLASALIQIQEASDELRRYLRSLELDPSRLESVEQRLAEIYKLARKHRLEPSQLPSRLMQLQTELDKLSHSATRLETLQGDIATALRSYHDQAEQLSACRRAAAAEFGAAISAAMQALGMPGGCFEVALHAHDQPAAAGAEGVEFLVSANPGQPTRPLSKVASGGELSRVSLAIQVIAANSARIPTLIFDEVDSGIGGAVAEVIGRHLRRLGASRQVLCVTHLPQVAAQAHHQFKVSKRTATDSILTEVIALAGEQRTAEIARMLGGVKLTKNSLAHAREMIASAQQDGYG